MSEVENEDLVFTLEILVQKLDEEMAPYAHGLIQNLVSIQPVNNGHRCCSGEVWVAYMRIPLLYFRHSQVQDHFCCLYISGNT